MSATYIEKNVIGDVLEENTGFSKLKEELKYIKMKQKTYTS